MLTRTESIAVDGYLYLAAIVFAKLSLLIFLYRIFHVDRSFRIAAWVTGSVFVGWGFIALLLAVFACRPVKASWDYKLHMDPKTICNPKAPDTENAYGFCNIITDFVLPIPMIWKMQMNLRKKIGIAMVFATGASYNSGRGSNPTASIIQIKIWSKRAPVPSLSAVLMTPRTVAIEVNIAIIIACLPALTPLFKRIPLLASLIPLSVRSKFSHAGVAQRAPWPQKLSGPH
ncbi:MAG: hypothetical protein LQ346_003571 [Caloplaca aetnensis]|nr:MAG: hypothetical protein LQ346_003571 [Caloplaca aetnensis]